MRSSRARSRPARVRSMPIPTRCSAPPTDASARPARIDHGPHLPGEGIRLRNRRAARRRCASRAVSRRQFHDGLSVAARLSPRAHAARRRAASRPCTSPGRLFSVAPLPVQSIPRLFARNERLVCHFDSALGPFVVVLVGAMLVSGVATVWDGVAIPPYADQVVRRDWRGRGVWLKRGARARPLRDGLDRDRAAAGPARPLLRSWPPNSRSAWARKSASCAQRDASSTPVERRVKM